MSLYSLGAEAAMRRSPAAAPAEAKDAVPLPLQRAAGDKLAASGRLAAA